MPGLPSLLVVTSAALVAVFGSLHLFYTFRGRLLLPRDDALLESMKRVSPVITRETTMWRAWIGFNATHSMSLILFGLIYSYLALAAPALLFGSVFLRILGLATLVAFVVLARRYFFSVPFKGVVVATALYITGLVAAGL